MKKILLPIISHHQFGRIHLKSTIRMLFVLGLALLFVGRSAQSQDLGDQLSKFSSKAAQDYISPMLAGWGASLNTGLFYSADLHDLLGFDVGVKLGLTQMVDEDKTFKVTLPVVTSWTGFTPNFSNREYVTNSAVGKTDSTIIPINQSGTSTNLGSYVLPGGFDLPAIAFPVAQINVGLPLGLEAMVRFIPTIDAGSAGKFGLMGFGARYDVDQWLPFFPIDIAVHFMTQKLSFKNKNDKDIFSATATAYGIEVSKRLLILTVYGGFQLESSSFNVADFTGTQVVNGVSSRVTVPGFTVEGKNKSSALVGVRLLLLIINVHAEYHFATVPTAAVGVGISIR
ncbi:MAG: hypothetical protein HY966_04615 [Ignavibacteriales bacterium]|nr:hypothetical protein [Ignavibacteriales bacterium]